MCLRACVHACMRACVLPKLLITSGVVWYGMIWTMYDWFKF